MALGYATWKPDSSGAITTLTTTGGTTQATGSTFLVLVDIHTGTLEDAVVTDNKGNTYTLVNSITHSFGFCRQGMYLCINGAGGAGHTATATWVHTQTLNTIAFVEYTAVGAGTLDATPTGVDNTAGSPTVPPSITTSVANELVFNSFATFGAQNETVGNSGAPWTIATSNATSAGQNGAISYQLVSTPASVADSFTYSGFDYAAALAISIKPASGPAAAPFIPVDLDERLTLRTLPGDFSPPNLLTQKTLKLPPFIQAELPGWTLRARGVYTDFASPNLIFRLPIATTPLAPQDLSQQVKYRWVGSDFNPPNLLTPGTLKLPPFAQSEFPGWAIRAKGVYTDFSPPNLLTQGTLKLPPFTTLELGGALSVRGVFTDFTPPNLSLSLLVGKAPLLPVEGSPRATYRGLYTDFTPPNLLLSTFAPAPPTPLLPQDISGIRLDARGLRSDFLPPNLTLTLPVAPITVVVPAGRHGSAAEARRRRELEVLHAKLEAFKEQRIEAERALIGIEDREVKARTQVLKRVKVRGEAPGSGLRKPIEHYAPVAKVIAQRTVALERQRAILNSIREHQAQAQRIERENEVERVDIEAATHFMQFLMQEIGWDE